MVQMCYLMYGVTEDMCKNSYTCCYINKRLDIVLKNYMIPLSI